MRFGEFNSSGFTPLKEKPSLEDSLMNLLAERYTKGIEAGMKVPAFKPFIPPLVETTEAMSRAIGEGFNLAKWLGKRAMTSELEFGGAPKIPTEERPESLLEFLAMKQGISGYKEPELPILGKATEPVNIALAAIPPASPARFGGKAARVAGKIPKPSVYSTTFKIPKAKGEFVVGLSTEGNRITHYAFRATPEGAITGAPVAEFKQGAWYSSKTGKKVAPKYTSGMTKALHEIRPDLGPKKKVAAPVAERRLSPEMVQQAYAKTAAEVTHLKDMSKDFAKNLNEILMKEGLPPQSVIGSYVTRPSAAGRVAPKAATTFQRIQRTFSDYAKGKGFTKVIQAGRVYQNAKGKQIKLLTSSPDKILVEEAGVGRHTIKPAAVAKKRKATAPNTLGELVREEMALLNEIASRPTKKPIPKKPAEEVSLFDEIAELNRLEAMKRKPLMGELGEVQKTVPTVEGLGEVLQEGRKVPIRKIAEKITARKAPKIESAEEFAKMDVPTMHFTRIEGKPHYYLSESDVLKLSDWMDTWNYLRAKGVPEEELLQAISGKTKVKNFVTRLERAILEEGRVLPPEREIPLGSIGERVGEETIDKLESMLRRRPVGEGVSKGRARKALKSIFEKPKGKKGKPEGTALSDFLESLGEEKGFMAADYPWGMFGGKKAKPKDIIHRLMKAHGEFKEGSSYWPYGHGLKETPLERKTSRAYLDRLKHVHPTEEGPTPLPKSLEPFLRSDLEYRIIPEAEEFLSYSFPVDEFDKIKFGGKEYIRDKIFLRVFEAIRSEAMRMQSQGIPLSGKVLAQRMSKLAEHPYFKNTPMSRMFAMLADYWGT